MAEVAVVRLAAIRVALSVHWSANRWRFLAPAAALALIVLAGHDVAAASCVAVGLGLACLLLGRWRACAVWPVARLTGIEVGDTITVTSWSGRRSARILLGGAIREVLLLEGSEPYAGDFVIRAIRGHQLSVDGALSGAPAAMPRRRTG